MEAVVCAEAVTDSPTFPHLYFQSALGWSITRMEVGKSSDDKGDSYILLPDLKNAI